MAQQALISTEHMDAVTAELIQNTFVEAYAIAEEWKAKAASIVIISEDQTVDMAMARTARIFLKNKRCAIESTRKKLTADLTAQVNAINGAARTLKGLIEPIEADLEAKEKFAERIEANRQAAAAEQARLAAEAAERERVLAEQAERERIRLENVRLQQEAEAARKRTAEVEAAARAERDAQEKALARERAKAAEVEAAARASARAEREALERKAAEERRLAEAKAKAERDAAVAAERARAEKARAEQIIKDRAAREEADRRLEVQRQAALESEKARKAAEQLVKDLKQPGTLLVGGVVSEETLICPNCYKTFTLGEARRANESL